jgi:hypothetical protein
MRAEQFDKLVEEFWSKCQTTLGLKRTEYAHSGDRLGNFKRVGVALGATPSEVALFYLLKHIDSLAQQVRGGTLAWDWSGPSEDGIVVEGGKQRFVDAINYLFLLAACVEDDLR